MRSNLAIKRSGKRTALWGVLPHAGAVGWPEAPAAGMVESRCDNDYSPLPLKNSYQMTTYKTARSKTVVHMGSRKMLLFATKRFNPPAAGIFG